MYINTLHFEEEKTKQSDLPTCVSFKPNSVIRSLLSFTHTHFLSVYSIILAYTTLILYTEARAENSESLNECVAKAAVSWTKPLDHRSSGSARHYNKGDLGKLSGEKETLWACEGMLKGADVDIRRQWKTLDVAVLVRRVIDLSHIAIADSLTDGTTKVDGLFLGVLVDDFHDREAGKRSWLGRQRRRQSVGRKPPLCPLKLFLHPG